MNSTQSTSSNVWCRCLSFSDSNSKIIILIALGIIALIGGLVGTFGVLGYLPPLAIRIGGVTCIASITSIAVFTIFCQRSSPGNGQNNRSNALDNSQRSLIPTAQHIAAYQSMSELVAEERVEEAWQSYLNTSFKETHSHQPSAAIQDNSFLGQAGWLYLPPEALLNAQMDRWATQKENIANRVCPEFLRDCAIQYTCFRNKCLKEDLLWSCFTGYQEYIADIAAKHSEFGLEVMTSRRGADIPGDQHRIEIFRSSYNGLLLLTKDNKLNEEKIKFFANFLLCFQLVIQKEDFEKIKEFSHILIQQRGFHSAESEEYRHYSFCITLMDLVEGKLSFQGIFEGERGKTCFPPVEADLISGLFDLNWIEEVSRKISAATNEENVRKGLCYLSLIPESSTHYADAQLMLGNVWLDLENFSEAGQCFLKVAKLNNEHLHDALLLASMSLLAAVEEDTKWAFVLREDMESIRSRENKVRLLSHDECKSWTLKLFLETVTRLEEKKNSATLLT